MTPRFTVVGLGEALLDVFADREVLGGAPLNVAVHANQLAAPLGGRGVPVSRVGDDERGRRIRSELSARGISSEFVQTDPKLPTGTVLVKLLGREPTFEIVADTAWDGIEFTPELERLAAECSAVCFGTLGQRSARSRETIREFVGRARGAVRMMDVNLRRRNFDEDILRASCGLADVIKLNEHELPRVVRLLGVADGGDADESADRLRRAFGLRAVALTRGEAGTALFTEQGRTVGGRVRYEPHPNADSVGAGDACSAGLLVGLLQGLPADRVVALANHMGAFVASQPGATPVIPESIRRMAAT